MSDCDSEEYSSSEDEDYVPSGGEYSEDDINDLVKESGDDEDEEGSKKSSDVKSNKKRSKNYPARKRKKGVLVLGSQEVGENSESQDTATGEKEDDIFSEIKQKKLEEAKKKREEDLWSSFLSDVGQKPKQQPLPSSSVNNQTPVEKPEVQVQNKETEKQEDSKMTITKVYDFAGEEVRVTKEVDSSSKEAMAFIKQQEKSQQEPSPVSSKTSVPGESGCFSSNLLGHACSQLLDGILQLTALMPDLHNCF
ncbi:craniofacial development protein 1 isoform X2 [Xenopus laevis]|uniref:Craniofacial development protein 1 isoform X2 n=1 Tax=Xenopus laevis TaxID=8355 RepID=A0A8J0V1C0_XENLA|nr:craniofacial development protein 1 isoform X2 [Xenopus laevis]